MLKVTGILIAEHRLQIASSVATAFLLHGFLGVRCMHMRMHLVVIVHVLQKANSLVAVKVS